MTEEYYVARDKQIKYEGYFSVAELYYIIDDFLRRYGYAKVEKVHDVRVYKSHREIELHLEPERHASDYVKDVLEISISFRDLIDVAIKDKDITKPVQSGKIRVKISALQITNKDNMWGTKPGQYLMRAIIDKFIYPGFLGESKDELKAHAELLLKEISAYLNISKYKFDNQSAVRSKDNGTFKKAQTTNHSGH